MTGLPALNETSPSGQPTCPSVGPLDASVVCLAESPARNEIKKQEPLVGLAGHRFDQALVAAQRGQPPEVQRMIRRSGLRLINVVPCLAPGNEFAKHAPEDLEWGLQRLRLELNALTGPKVLVCMGSHPAQYVAGLVQGESIGKWRGSLLPPMNGGNGDLYNRYWQRYYRDPLDWQGMRDVAYMPTYHPAAILRRMEWMYWLVNDLRRAARYAAGVDYERREREWYLNEPGELRRLVEDVIIGGENAVAIDTEMEPLITCLVTEEEVHSFVWGEEYREPLAELMRSEQVMKIAHNMAHDWRQFEKIYGLPVRRPWFDTVAGAHVLEPSGGRQKGRSRKELQDGHMTARAGSQQVGKALSPHIATRYTGWPYHKWLDKMDGLAYCGIDTVVAYDAYWSQVKELHQPGNEKLRDIVNQSHRLFEPLFRAQELGLLVDEERRSEVADDWREQCRQMEEELREMAWPYIEKALDAGRLEKPHLFRVTRQCPCCGGGSAKREACWSCAGFESAPKKSELESLHRERYGEPSGGHLLKADLEELLLEPCRECGGEGSYEKDQELNLGSSDQVKDLLYKAMGIPARRYQGTVTTRFEQLERMLEPGQRLEPGVSGRRAEQRRVLMKYVELAKLRSELDTIERLEPGDDGRLRTVFDIWYTPTYRVASRESLLDVGTNLQNIPKDARRFIVPDPGEFFLYPDYAQIEGRAQAVLSQDKALLEIYRKGGDSHMAVRDLIEEETGISITRSQAKRVSFASFYDIEEDHLAEILGVSRLEARRVLRAFFRVFKGAARYKQKVEQELRASRSNTSPTGWVRRWLGYVMETSGKRKGQVKRKIRKEALASGPQNMAAWVMAEGLLAVWDEVGYGNPALGAAGEPGWIKIQCHVHDSALLGVPLDRAQEAIPLAERLMTVDVPEWDMTFPVEAVVGPDWYGASVDDEDKADAGYDGWQRDRVIADGVPHGDS